MCRVVVFYTKFGINGSLFCKEKEKRMLSACVLSACNWLRHF